MISIAGSRCAATAVSRHWRGHGGDSLVHWLWDDRGGLGRGPELLQRESVGGQPTTGRDSRWRARRLKPLGYTSPSRETVPLPMADAPTSTVFCEPGLSAASTLAALSTEELMDAAAETAHRVGALLGRFVELVGELDRRQGWRDEGATSLEAWIVERCGVSVSTARAWAHVAGRLFDLPQLASALCAGEISFDKVRAVVDVATPETDGALVEKAAECSVRQLAELARSTTGTGAERARIRRRPPVPAVQRHVPHSVRPAPSGVLRRGQEFTGDEGPTNALRRRDALGPAPL